MPSIKTPIGMLSFPHLFVPKPRSQGGEPCFSLSLVFDEAAQKSPEWINLKRAVAEAIDDEFGAGKSKDANFLRTLRMPWRRADEKQYAGYDPGKVFISPWTKTRPGLVDGNLQDITAASDVWAGQLARSTVTPFAYTNSGNRGVSLMLNNVQITKSDMTRMDGRKNANQDFEAVGTGTGTGADLDDEIPF